MKNTNLSKSFFTYSLATLALSFSLNSTVYANLPDEVLQAIAPYQGISIVPLDEQNVPGPLREMARAQILEMNSQGYINATPDEVGKLENAKGTAKKTLKSLNEIRKGLAIEPASFKDSPLNLPGAKLLGARQTGAMIDGKSTGLFRLFAVPKLGLIGLSENDFSLASGGMKMTAEAINYEVNGKPAVLSVKKVKKGRSQSELLWATDNKIYKLITNRAITGKKSISNFINFAESIEG